MKQLFSILLMFYFPSIKAEFIQKTIDNQSIEIISLENIKFHANIKTDIVYDQITIDLDNKDHLLINGFRSFTQEIKILNKKSVELRFSIRGGTGVANERDLIFCISNNKLFKVFDIIAMVSSEFNETYNISIDSLHLYYEHCLLDFKILDILEKNNDFSLKAIEYSMFKSKFKPSDNQEIRDTIILKFNFPNRIFFNKTIKIQGQYSVIHNVRDQDVSGTIITTVVFNSNECYTISSRAGDYYNIDHKWHMKGRKGHLIEMD
jgi:hypothetical protein